MAWVPIGPGAPTSPTPSWPIYAHLAEGDCSGLQAYLNDEDDRGRGVGDFGTALVAVCRAAVQGQDDQWEVARAFKDADASSLVNPCLVAVMTSLLERALAWHDRNPGRPAQVALSPGTGTTPCPETGNPPDTATPPDTGVPDGGSGAETSEKPE